MITINDDCINLIKSFEGLFLEAYQGKADKPGIHTIGYGTIQYPPYYMGGKMVKVGDPDITEAQAIDFLKYEVNKKLTGVDLLIRDDLTVNQYGALVSFAYNLGTTSLKNSKLREKINTNPNNPAIRKEFDKWTCSNGKCGVKGLIRRRKAEADLYFKP
jgi:lysozyme